MVWKTRKNTRRQRKTQRGGSLLNLFKKKTPVTTTATATANVTPVSSNNAVSYTRKGSEENFISIKKRKAFAAKSIRNHVKKIKNLSNEIRVNALKLMNDSTRSKIQPLLNYKNLNSLSNDNLIEFYSTGKVRSSSY